VTRGERLREVREYLCLSHDEVHEQTGLDVGALDAIERGVRVIDELELQRVARSYGYPPTYFLHGGVEQAPAGGPPRLLSDLTEHDQQEVDRFRAFLQDTAGYC